MIIKARNLIFLKGTKYARAYALKKSTKLCTYFFFIQNVREYNNFIIDFRIVPYYH